MVYTIESKGNTFTCVSIVGVCILIVILLMLGDLSRPEGAHSFHTYYDVHSTWDCLRRVVELYYCLI